MDIVAVARCRACTGHHIIGGGPPPASARAIDPGRSAMTCRAPVADIAFAL